MNMLQIKDIFQYKTFTESEILRRTPRPKPGYQYRHDHGYP